MTDHSAKATKWLDLLRKGDDNYSMWLDAMRRELASGNLTPEDIGTTEAEIETCRVAGCKTAATKWLDLLRKGDDNYSMWLDAMRRELASGNLTPEDIGTTEAEIETCRVAGCKTAATKWLDLLRKGDDNYSMWLDAMRRELASGNLTPEDIGTTEAEIASIKKVA